MIASETDIAHVRQISRVFVRELGLIEGGTGITLAQCHAMVEIDKYGVLNIKRLAEILHVDASTMSRNIKRMISVGWVTTTTDRRDRRAQLLTLTDSGRDKLEEVNESSTRFMSEALDKLSITQRQTVEKGLDLYVTALTRQRVQSLYSIRTIEQADNVYLAGIIRTVLAEFGVNRAAVSRMDPEIDHMHEKFTEDRSTYFVAHSHERVVGGAGVAPMKGGGFNVCEIQKMYLLEEARGVGLGARLMEKCLQTAKENGFRMVYIETHSSMEKARDLYAHFGFKSITAPMGINQNDNCNFWMMKVLT